MQHTELLLARLDDVEPRVQHLLTFYFRTSFERVGSVRPASRHVIAAAAATSF